MSQYPFVHERLDVYRVAVGVARWARGQKFPRGLSGLRDQLVRATSSVVLNIAEGASHLSKGSRVNHYRIARASAAESCAVLDLLDLPEASDRQQELRRVGAMLTRLIQ